MLSTAKLYLLPTTMNFKYLVIAALAASVAAAPAPAPNNDFDAGNIYTKYEDLVSCI